MGQVQSIPPLRMEISNFATSALDIARQNKWSVIFGVTVAWTGWNWFKTARNLPPGPIGLPFIGALYCLTGKIHLDFIRLSNIYGDIISLKFGGKYMVVLNSQRAIKEAFVKTAVFSDRPKSINGFFDFSDEIFTQSYTEKFRENKKFALQTLKNFGFGTANGEKRIQQEVNILAEYLANQNGTAVNMADPFCFTAMNIISSILFNQNSNWEDPDLKEFLDHITTFVSTLDSEGLRLLLAGGVFPDWANRILLRGSKKRSDMVVNSFRNFIKKRIEDHRESFDSNNLRDFVDVYIKERSSDPDFSDDVFIDTTMIFLPDAVHSLSAIMHWFFLYVGNHQDIQAAIQEQIDEICSTRPPTLSDRSKLHLLEATILETMRLSNVSPVTPPHCSESDQVLGGYNIPASTVLIANLYAVHMDPELFPNPEQFKPERHLDEDGKLLKNVSVIPFGVGRRMCMGETLSRTEIFLLTATLLQRFHFTFTDDQPNPSLKPCGTIIQTPEPYKIRALSR